MKAHIIKGEITGRTNLILKYPEFIIMALMTFHFTDFKNISHTF